MENPSQPFTEVADTSFQIRQPVIQKQSGLGIASFIIALMSYILIISLVVVVASISSSVLADIGFSGTVTPQQIKDNLPLLVPIILLLIGAVLISLIGMILGLIGLFQKNRKKMFALIGVILNSLGWIIIIILFVVQSVSKTM